MRTGVIFTIVLPVVLKSHLPEESLGILRPSDGSSVSSDTAWTQKSEFQISNLVDSDVDRLQSII